MPLYRIEIEADNESDMECCVADGRWKEKIVEDMPDCMKFNFQDGKHVEVTKLGDGNYAVFSDLLQFDDFKQFKTFDNMSETAIAMYRGKVMVLLTFIRTAANCGVRVDSAEFQELVRSVYLTVTPVPVDP